MKLRIAILTLILLALMASILVGCGNPICANDVWFVQSDDTGSTYDVFSGRGDVIERGVSFERIQACQR